MFYTYQVWPISIAQANDVGYSFSPNKYILKDKYPNKETIAKCDRDSNI